MSRLYAFAAAAVLCADGAAASASNVTAQHGVMLDACRIGAVIYAAGERGKILRSEDSGDRWETVSTPTHATLTAINFIDSQHGWAVGHDGTILSTNDGAITWSLQSQSIDPEISFLDICILDTRTAIAVGAFGACYITQDFGRNWTRHQILDEELHLNRAGADQDGRILVAGEQGTLLRLDGIKGAVERLETGYEGSFHGILALGSNDWLVYGLRGHAFRSPDGGSTWNRLAGLPPIFLAAGLRHSSGHVILAGQARNFLVSHDGGATYSPTEAPVAWAVSDLVEAPNQMVIIAGEGGIARYSLPEMEKAPESPPPTSR